MSKNPPRIKDLTALYGLPAWYGRAFGWLVFVVFDLIALGGAVRLMNAGLACPDWPLCFGDVIPDYHPQVYLEFIHRAVAGGMSIAALMLMIYLWRSNAPRALKVLGAVAMGLVGVQVILGGLTVLWQLHARIVAAHLGTAAAFFSVLLWIYLSIKPTIEDGVVIPKWIRNWSILTGIAIFGQIILGGMVASHYAALACTEFPTCNGAWFPTFDGVIGLHIIHRLGAYAVAAIGLVNLVLLVRKSGSIRMRKIGIGNFMMVLTQIGIGIANVLLQTPPLIAVLHLATATAILSMAVRQIHFARIHAQG